MSGSSASTNNTTTKLGNPVNEQSQTPSALQQQANKPAVLEEDDEFEDFPVEDWADEDTDLATGTATTGTAAAGHLWEESWDDDDTSDDFAQMLKEELKKVQGSK